MWKFFFGQNVNVLKDIACHKMAAVCPVPAGVTKWSLSVLYQQVLQNGRCLSCTGSSSLQHMQTTADGGHTTAARLLFCLTQNVNLNIFMIA